MNAIQMEELYEAIDKVISQKEEDLFIVFFGANKVSELGIKYLQDKGIRVSAIIDNGKDKEGLVKCGVRVFTPESALAAYKENAVIFTASRYVKPMTRQLETMGYKRNVHIFETIYHIPSLDLAEFETAAQKAIEGEQIFKNIEKKPEETLIFCPYKGIGDIYFISAYFEEYLKKEKIKEYRLIVVGNACRRVAGMFGIQPVLSVSQKEMDRITKYISFVGISNFNVRILNHNYMHFNILSLFEEKGKISWGKLFLCGIMGFENEMAVKGVKPKERKVRLSGYEGLKRGKTVILAPYANTVSNADTGLWEKLAADLKSAGYEVFTNSTGESEPVISGTLPLSAPLEDMAGIIEYAGYFIGIRSGICDLVSAAEAKKVVLYPDRGSMFFKMEDMGIAEDVTEIIMYEEENIEKSVLNAIE